MEKYGVSQPKAPPGEKMSSEGAKCPWCGKPAATKGGVLHCPEHGTEPWER